MKKVLFIIGYLGSGGISKSLVNLLSVIDKKRYDVHLLVMSSRIGAYEEFVPIDVNIHRIPEIGYILSGFAGLLPLLKHGHLFLAFGSIIRMIVAFFSKAKAAQIMAQLFPKFEGSFDMIVDYNGQQNLYYMVDKLEGKKMISFFHSDYAKYSFYYRSDKKYYPKVDVIFTISDLCVNSMKEFFPEISEKIHLFENISNPEIIQKLALQEEILPTYNGVVLVTVGLVTYNKGIDLIIGAAEILRQKKIDFKWLMLGSTDGAGKYLQQIQSLGLSDSFIFKGVQKNPYPYMKRATVMVHASRFEGKSITLDEAKILCKPVVVTNFSTVGDQFEHGVNASICEMTSLSLSEAILGLINSSELRRKYTCSLEETILDNSSEVNKLYDLIES